MFVQVALPVPLAKLFDYRLSSDLALNIQTGLRVKVPFGTRILIGIIFKINTTSILQPKQLKSVIEVCDTEPLFLASWCEFTSQLAAYYHHPIGEVAFTGLPAALRQHKKLTLGEVVNEPIVLPDFLPSDPQQQVIEQIISRLGQFKVFLLEGITGSGKTEVYLQITQAIFNNAQQVLILVPEIALTPQTLARFKSRFGSVIYYHSQMTDKERQQAWLQVRYAKVQIVVGTRSAIFLPFLCLQLIIVDEEHDLSFKQQEGFRYHARDAAIFRAKLQNCPVILGSATPAFESLHNAQLGKYEHLKLTQRVQSLTLPTIQLLDVRHKKLIGGLSLQLISAIQQHHQQGGQVLLFINRRGFAPVIICTECGWKATCHRCDASLTWHQDLAKLICHHCLMTKKLPTHCPDCQTDTLQPLGQGTQKIEHTLQQYFSENQILRIDSDVTRKKGYLASMLPLIQSNEIPILIGTQILAKGHHFPKLSLVAIIDADSGLFSGDFRAIERMGQLIIQVAGRAGRETLGEVIIQTFNPEHPWLQLMLQQHYTQFAQLLLAERKHSALPPYSHLALLRTKTKHATQGHDLLNALKIKVNAFDSVHLLGPIPAPMLKRQGFYHHQLLLQSANRSSLHQTILQALAYLQEAELAKRVRWSLDVDPIEMF